MKGLGGLSRREEAQSMRKEYLRRIDAQAVLDHYGAQNAHQVGDEVIHSCLLDRVDPHHQNGDANPSASLNVEKKVYNCYSYGGGDILWFIAKMEGKEDIGQIVPFLSDFLGDSTVDVSTFLEELEGYLKAPQATEELQTYHPRVLQRWAKYHPYLRSRGISKETAVEFKLGYDERNARITIPHWVDGKLVGWQRRSLSDPRWPQTEVERAPDGTELDGGRIPKYKNSTNFPKDTTLYRYDAVRDERAVIVVESPMSVAKAHSCGITNVVATFGSKVNDAQVAKLRSFGQVIVWFDADPAGEYGAYRLIEGLYRHTMVTHVIPEPGKDMADYDRDGMMERLKLPNIEPGILALARLEKTYGRRQR
ncbi:DNA primase [Gordonia phage RedWattleHog]|uniref:DNA primase n=1 Tax=Gordonia phage Stormageddon TaxID=2656541 RepID=A0A649VSF3_9CAUD|nr:DNA primase [Gordonia phage Stormageddon]QGJ94935.1 DNA primase [Gordonia phage Stormageddon]QLF83579.1 DNA primase [Gordonia phage RedWattleHog]